MVLAAPLARNESENDRCSLPSEEWEKALSIIAPDVRRRFLAGRRLLRETLSAWLGISPALIDLRKGVCGKPYLGDDPSLHFSISHSGEMVLAAFSRSLVGADLERERPVDAVALARRFFSAEEATLFADSLSPDQEQFFRLWTCREAAIKGDGRGMGALLGSTRVILPSSSSLASSASGSSGSFAAESEAVLIGDEHWCVIPWRLSGHYHAAIAFLKPPSLIRWHDLR